MNERITYLLGAGASALGVPISNKLTDSIKTLLEQFKYVNMNLQSPDLFPDVKEITALAPLKHNGYFEKMLEILEYLLKIGEAHPSLDTYARKLTITGDTESELYKFKSSLVVLFSIIEAINLPDKRYDLWLSSILHVSETLGAPQLPDEVNIISWNYDNQIERAYSQYIKGRNFPNDIYLIDTVCRNLNIIEKSESERAIRFGGSNVIKLNGSAKFISLKKDAKKEQPTILDQRGLTVNRFKLLIDTYKAIADRPRIENRPMISFAWEKDALLEDPDLHSILQFTNRLVIIGYSFPDFNRNVDVELFGHMTNLELIQIVDDPNYFEARKASIRETFNEALINIPLMEVGTKEAIVLESIEKFPITSGIRFK